MSSSSCPFCHLTLPSSDLERHANSHFEDEDIQLKQQQQQLAADFELAQQIALSPSPKLHSISLLSEQSIRDMQFESTSGSKKSWCHDRNMDDREWTMEEKISCLIDLQTRSTFYKVEGGLMALLRKCLESEPGKTTSILSGYIDHFQSIVSEDVGWGCGWRNIQMLSSHLLVQRQEVREVLFGGSGFVPDIPSLQRWLEIAWERGFDVLGSDQFSHSIYGSKKWIGATECASLLRSFGLRARIVDFGPKKYESLYLSVPGSSIGAQGMRTNTKKKSKEVHLYGPIDRYFSRDVHQAGSSCQETSNSFKVQVDSTIGIRSREDIANNITKNSEGHQFLMDFVWNYFSDQSSTTFGNQHVIVSEKTAFEQAFVLPT
ncbi:Zinc finger with UFM1-specific peptidase domain protein [Quillaja saponaria]|uniref:Zinc finger with UFM1-specific peptidase domain protein n=1 Tax=Quillaja saponaria TaxID=32244 RepID=A0AAD7PSE8_QUISA|nr:Zinc finger with UFM1-specific peptidase domain protein [Quillaja saponaria]